MKVFISDQEIAEVFSKFNFGDRADDSEWRRKTVATQLLKLTGGYVISYSQKSVLKALKLLKGDNMPNKKGRQFMCDTLLIQDFS